MHVVDRHRSVLLPAHLHGLRAGRNARLLVPRSPFAARRRVTADPTGVTPEPLRLDCRAAARQAFIEVLVELHDHDFLDVIKTATALLSNLDDALVLALAIVGEPARDLLHRQSCLLCQHLFVTFLDVRVLNIVYEPLLQYARLAFGEHLTAQLLVVQIVAVLVALFCHACGELLLLQLRGPLPLAPGLHEGLFVIVRKGVTLSRPGGSL